MTMTRRALLGMSALGLTACSLPKITLSESKDYDFELTAEPADVSILPNTITPSLAFNGLFPAPVIRVKQGVAYRIKFTNKLDEPTTIHWHGIRIDIKMDGVPHLSQPPIAPGESFIYHLNCPDAGTFWYHPHMNSVEQLGRGLVGVLIVEESKPQPYGDDVIIGLKDWRLEKNGSFAPISIPRFAARAGTLGNVATVNGLLKPRIEVAANTTARLRFCNLDNTRVYNLSLKNRENTDVIAIDGSPIEQPYALENHATGAGMRLDLALKTPSAIGEEIIIYDKKGIANFEICRLVTVAKNTLPAISRRALPANPLPVLDLENAQKRSFVFEWAGALSPVDEAGKIDPVFWTINKRNWEGMKGGNIPAPLAILELGKTYIFEMYNATPHHHPIHLHGVIFRVLASDKKSVTPWDTDTVLMEKNERVKIAFVADNPGRWMFHCHVIEHMKTGLMGYITIA